MCALIYKHAPNIESCVVEINRIKARKLFIFTLYKAPDRKLEHFVESLGNVYYVLFLRKLILFIILGDFNVNVLAAKKDHCDNSLFILQICIIWNNLLKLPQELLKNLLLQSTYCLLTIIIV